MNCSQIKMIARTSIKSRRWSACWIMFLLVSANAGRGQGNGHLKIFPAHHPGIQYTGRVDFANPALPRFWQPGVYVEFNFSGRDCHLLVNDEMLWGVNNNYLEIVLDGKATRVQTKAKRDTIYLDAGSAGAHSLLLCKNTEANIGWLEFAGVMCEALLPPTQKPSRKIEFIGNSITCGTGADQSVVPCGKGKWQDQHNAYLSYGPVTARTLGAQCHLSGVSGIGLMRSCCNMDVIMPQVYDKVSMRNDTIRWNFALYQPDVVTVCLGQNDGKQPRAMFRKAYIDFLRQLRTYYPAAEIICLSSPMADRSLARYFKRMLPSIIRKVNKEGDAKVSHYLFSRQYRNGCDSHPDLSEHAEIAHELATVIRERMKW